MVEIDFPMTRCLVPILPYASGLTISPPLEPNPPTLQSSLFHVGINKGGNVIDLIYTNMIVI